MIINEKAETKIIPIASGKGGVGKSFFSSNLAVSLAQSGKKTTLVDLDLGGSNLHTYLGIKNTNPGIGNYLSDRKTSFEDIIFQTEIPNLSFVPGDVLVTGMANITGAQKNRLISNIEKLDGDYVIIDLASGSQFSIIDFFLISNSGFLVVNPHAPSLLNTYSFLKTTVFRFIQRAFNSNKKVAAYMNSVLKEKKPGEIPPFSEIEKEIAKRSGPVSRNVKKSMELLKLKLIVNMADQPEDIGFVEKLRDLIKKFLGLDTECLGLIYRDKAVPKSLDELSILYTTYPSSLAAGEVERIGQKIIQSKNFPHMPLDLDYYKDSFELAEIEATNDYEILKKNTAVSTKDELDTRELINMISSQKKQINELKNTVRMLTMKNAPKRDRL
jgi:flagellar biosynthesis protein FlhG